MNHRVHYFHDLGLSYLYYIKAMSMIAADQLTLYVKTKNRVYICIKKTSAKLSSSSNLSLGKLKFMSFIILFYPFSLNKLALHKYSSSC